MRATILDEPELEFGGGGRHIDPRHGIADYGPVDAGAVGAPTEISVGLVGTQESIDGLRRWLERCRSEIPAKQPNRYPRLFRDFPGFDIDVAFRSRLVFDQTLTRVIPARALTRATSKPGALAAADAVELYREEVAHLADSNRCKVIVCVRPDQLDERADKPPSQDDEADTSSIEVDSRKVDFHDLLKAQTIHPVTPIQLIRPTTWGVRKRPSSGTARDRGHMQDEATRAWNLHTALYYKAGGVPWRLVRQPTDITSLYVGVSFFHTPDRRAVHTSVAQVFNERGDGVVVRGGPAARHKDDRQPHLSEGDAEGLLASALDVYRGEHRNFPARVVLQKTSEFDDAEVRGFERASDARAVDLLEMIWIQSGEQVRLFRTRENAVLRGTMLHLESNRHTLFTRGSVDFYGVYPGMYVPVPIGLHFAMVEHDPEYLAREILALSKMNWNQSQLDGRLPITLRAAHQVASILKHLAPDAVLAPRYAHYM
jgi:hypothetical protein